MVKTICFFWITGLFLTATSVEADPIVVRFQEGSVHGFLVIRTLEGKVLASGDLTQVVRGNRAVTHLAFRFKDGSVDDETAVFSQHGTFHLISDHHVQKGPTFPEPTNVLIHVSTGEVTVRYQEKGREKVITEHLDLPPDLANGLMMDVLKNIPANTKETKVSYVAVVPKPRLVHLSITPQDEETFTIANTRHKATHFKVKVELGGITGIVAPIIGKQPADTDVWVMGGDAPAFVKLEGPLYAGGPVWRVEMSSPVWSQARPASH